MAVSPESQGGGGGAPRTELGLKRGCESPTHSTNPSSLGSELMRGVDFIYCSALSLS